MQYRYTQQGFEAFLNEINSMECLVDAYIDGVELDKFGRINGDRDGCDCYDDCGVCPLFFISNKYSIFCEGLDNVFENTHEFKSYILQKYPEYII